MASMKKAAELMVVVLAVMASLATLGSACGTSCSHPGKPGNGGGAGSGNGGGAGGVRTCPVDIIKLNVCSPLLGGVVAPGCCPLLGLLGVDLEVCLCLAVDVNVLGLVTVEIPKLDIVAKIATSCGYNLPPNFTCP